MKFQANIQLSVLLFALVLIEVALSKQFIEDAKTNVGFGKLCSLDNSTSFDDYVACVRGRRFRRYVSRNYQQREDYGHPCHSYVKLSQPERRTTNQINALNDSALCDRRLRRRWYRFVGPGGSVMPEECVDEYSCGTHSPIWMNGQHPTSYGEIVDREVCASLAGKCCTRRWFIRVAFCGDFYSYLLTDTPGCFMAYCAGNEQPCPAGQSSLTGFSPHCTENFPPLAGKAMLSINKNDPNLKFYCDYSGPIRTGSVIVAEWFVEGDRLFTEEESKFPVYTDEMVERRRSVLLESQWMGRMGARVFCQMRAHWTNKTGVPSPMIESDKYFAGIKILKRLINVSESEEESQIQIQSTVPVSCLPQFGDACKITIELAHDSEYEGKQCIDGKMNQVVFGDCKIDITPSNWRDVHNVSVKAVRDFYNDGNKKMRVGFKPVYSTYASIAWNDYQLPEVEVLANDAPTAMCSSTGDPHYTTFDGLYYHVYLEGEFVLYKNTRNAFQINTRLEECGKVVSCNCAVAVRVADDVIVIDRCARRHRNLAYGQSFPEGWRSVHKHALEQGDSFSEGLRIYEHDDGRRYTVHMPTGAYLDFRVGENWVNIFLHGSSDDWKSTLGLCGTFDGNRSNDFTFPDGVTQTVPRDDESCGESPDVCQFSESWRVPDSESFFGQVVEIPLMDPQPVRSHQYCKCQQSDGDQSDIVCNYQHDIQNCEEAEEKEDGVDKTEEFMYRSKRMKRSVELTDKPFDDYFSTEFVYDKTYVGKEPKWPTKTGITEDYARNRCYSAIMFSNVGRICHRHIYNMLNQLMDSCVTDIKVTEDFRWIQSSLDTLTAECVNNVHINPVYWPDQPTFEASTPAIPVLQASYASGQSVLDSICPSGCSQKGHCIEHHCKCFAGFTGADCSIPVNLPPKVMYIADGGMCDIRRRPCIVTTVYGANFRSDSSLQCIFKEQSTGAVLRMEAEFSTFEEVSCHLPALHMQELDQSDSALPGSTYKVYSLSIKQDGIGSNEDKLVIVYDSVCRDCAITTEGHVCHRKNDSCEIRGYCYAEGDVSSTDCCKVCTPTESQDEFVIRTDERYPVIQPATDVYSLVAGKQWHMSVSAIGCDVTYSVINRINSTESGDKIHKGLDFTVKNDGVDILSAGATEGLVAFQVLAKDRCGGLTSSKNYTVKIVQGSTTTANPLCAGKLAPSFVEPSVNFTVVEGELFKVLVQAAGHPLTGHNLNYSVLKRTSSYVSISDSGLLRYEAPHHLGQERVTVIVDDDCHQTAYKEVTFNIVSCPCLNAGQCIARADQPKGRGLYDCHCDSSHSGDRCQIEEIGG